jgi:peptidoglycan/LPS O-acetylase OafA/YrhL
MIQNPAAVRNDSAVIDATSYLPALDGLRFFAFLAVFIHHLPDNGIPRQLALVKEYGWAGVELFFVISSFLFFHLFKIEQKRAGAISRRRFFIRRFLRIYPLMAVYPLLAIAIDGVSDWPNALARYAGLLLFSDNLITAHFGYHSALPLSAHLWTLSFEFQIYLLIPFAFVMFHSMGARRFALVLLGVWLVCLVLRALFIAWQVPHPAIWVLPFLRPESVLVGLLIAMGLRTHPLIVAAAGAAALALLVSGMNVFAINWELMLLYPCVALVAGSLVWLALNVGWVGRLWSTRILRQLGLISYGLYVFHIMAILLTNRILGAGNGSYGVRFALALVICLALSIASYVLLERPFLKLKERKWTVVQGRVS